MATDLEEDMGVDLEVVMEAAMGVALEVDTQEAADSVEEEVLEAADSAVVVLETTDSRPHLELDWAQDLEPLLDLSWEDLEELPLVVLEVDSLVQRSVKVDSADKSNEVYAEKEHCL